MNSKSPLLSTLFTLAGCAIVFGSLMLTVVFPQLHLGVLVVVGGLLGSPLIVLGMRLHPQSIWQEEAEKSFWPTGTELGRWLWGSVAIATVLVCYIGPVALAIAVGLLLPPGDQWGAVALRLLWIVAAVVGWVWWVKFVSARIPAWFRGRVSEAMLDAMTRQQVAEEAMTAKAAAIRRWQLVPTGLGGWGGVRGDPPINRWAIVGRPWRDLVGAGWKCGLDAERSTVDVMKWWARRDESGSVWEACGGARGEKMAHVWM